MTDHRLCVKCESTQIMRVPGQGSGAGSSVIVVGMRAIPVTRYICFHCGFVEQWVESRAGLERMRDKFGFVRDSPPPPAPDGSIESELGLA